MKVLERKELAEVVGGVSGIPRWIKGSVWFIVAAYIVDNWSDIKAGIVDGYTDGAKS
jgi:hypothetical protein